MGRPPKEIDYEKLEALAGIQCTNEEMAAVLGIHKDTFYDRMKNDSDFSDCVKRGKESGKASLRRMQWKAAQKGSAAMLIWLGKQILGQREPKTESDDERDINLTVKLPDVSKL